MRVIAKGPTCRATCSMHDTSDMHICLLAGVSRSEAGGPYLAQARRTCRDLVLADHESSFGQHAKTMLQVAGHEIDDHLLQRWSMSSRKECGLSTTPLIEIESEEIDGSDALEEYLKEQA